MKKAKILTLCFLIYISGFLFLYPLSALLLKHRFDAADRVVVVIHNYLYFPVLVATGPEGMIMREYISYTKWWCEKINRPGYCR